MVLATNVEKSHPRGTGCWCWHLATSHFEDTASFSPTILESLPHRALIHYPLGKALGRTELFPRQR